MLVELSVMKQRYHAVMEVISGAPVTEVARRYGVSRQAVHGWLGRYEQDGLPGLADHSHRPHHQPRQLDAGIEALICQLRRAHPRWGPRRLLFELGKARVSPLPSRSTIYRVLVRHGLVAARKRKRRRQDYKRWQREAPRRNASCTARTVTKAAAGMSDTVMSWPVRRLRTESDLAPWHRPPPNTLATIAARSRLPVASSRTWM